MARITLGYPNRIDEATLSGGSWLSALPLDNLKSRVLTKLARSAGAALASTLINLDLGQARTIGAIALVAHNLSVDALVRMRGAAAADFAGPLIDTGWVQVWPSGMIPQELLEWEDDNFWLGTLSAEARAGYQAAYIALLAARITARYWRIEIGDTGNADGSVHMGRVVICDTWQPGYNYSYGTAPLGFEDRSRVSESLGGTEYFDVLAKARVSVVTLDWLNDGEVYSRLLEMQRMLGVTGELLLVADPDDAARMPQRAYLARLLSLSPPTHASHNIHRATLTVKEIL